MLSEADSSQTICREFRLSVFSLTARDMDAVTKFCTGDFFCYTKWLVWVSSLQLMSVGAVAEADHSVSLLIFCFLRCVKNQLMSGCSQLQTSWSWHQRTGWAVAARAWQPVCLSNAAFVSVWLDMFFEWLAEPFSIPLDSVLSLGVCEPFIVNKGGELCMYTTAKAELNSVLCYSWVRAVGERVKWPQLLSILLPKPLWTCRAPCHLSLTIFTFSSFQVSANTSATQSVRALG